jgi:hypothetical protein
MYWPKTKRFGKSGANLRRKREWGKWSDGVMEWWNSQVVNWSIG